MIPLLRKMVFYLFVAIYVACCPLMIMYALGYLYKPGEERGIIKTGLIYISAAPEGATVYLNGSRFTGKTPTILRDLLPGNYQIKLVLKGYGAWADTVPVEAEKATVLDSVLLLPEKWTAQLVLGHKFSDIIPFTDSGFFLVKASDRILDFFVCGHSGDKSLRVVSPFSSFAEEPVTAWYAPSMEASSAIFVTASPGGPRYVWAAIAGGKVRTKDITRFFRSSPDRIEWRHDNGRYLFAITAGRVDRIDAARGAVYPDYLSGVRGFGLSDSDIYAVGEDGAVTRFSYDRREKKPISSDGSLASEFAEMQGFVRVFAVSDDTVFFLDEKGRLLSNRPPYRILDSGVKDIEYCPERKRLLILQEDAVSVLEFAKEGSWLEEETASAFNRICEGKRMQQAFWAYQGSYVVIRDGEEVFLLGLDVFGSTKPYKVMNVRADSSIFYAERTGRLYYLDRASGALMSIDIVPPRGIMPAPFTELKEKIKILRRAYK